MPDTRTRCSVRPLQVLRFQRSIQMLLYNRRCARAGDKPLEEQPQTTARQCRRWSKTASGRPIRAPALVAPLFRLTLQGNRRSIAGLHGSPTHSDAVMSCKIAGYLQKRINHPTVQNCIEMASVESPAIEP